VAARRRRRLAGCPGAVARPTAAALSFGQPSHRYRRLGSTQAVARKLAEGDAPEGAIVVAGEQTGGRGRAGNTFFSPPGGLYVSLVLRPTLDPALAPLIGLAAGLALAEAVQAQTGAGPILKWPNDLLLNGRKLSGLIVDLTTAGTGIRYAILGIGVNVNVPEDAFPAELRDTATSLLRETGRETNLDDLLGQLLTRLEVCYGQLVAGEPVVDAWRSAPNFLGQQVRAAAANEVLEGVAEDLDTDGALLLRLASGELRRVIAADVHLL